MLDLLVAVHAGEGVDAGAVLGVQLDLRARGQGRGLAAQRRELADQRVQLRVGREVLAAPVRGAVDQGVVEVGRHLAGEHRLTGVLVVAVAHEALLVAVVDDGLAAGQQHGLVREGGALVEPVGAAEQVPDAAHVVVAHEGGQVRGGGVGGRVVVVGGEQPGHALRGVALGPVGRGGLVGEVEHRVHLGVPHVGGQQRRVGVVHLAEGEELVPGRGRGLVVDQGGGEGLPEGEVDVLDGVDAESVDPEVHPGGVDVRHRLGHARVFGHQVVEAVEVAEGDGLAFPRRVAAVVVHRHVVERLGDHHSVLLRADRGVGERGLRIEGGEVRGLGERRDVHRVPVLVEVGGGGLVDVAVLALLVVDEVRGVVGDDVEVHLDPARVRVLDQRLELLVGAQMRVDGGEVGDPVAVVAGARVGALALHGVVREGRGQPDGAHPQALDVVELRVEPGDVPALVEALVGGVEAVVEAVSLEAAGVIARIAVLEAVGEHEVEGLAAAGVAVGGRRELGVRLGVRPALLSQCDGQPRGLRIEAEGHLGGRGDGQRDVVLPAVQAVGLVPAAADRGLDLELPGRHLEGRLPLPGRVGGGKGGGLAGRVPVLAAAQLVLQGAREHRLPGADGVHERGGAQHRRRAHRQCSGDREQTGSHRAGGGLDRHAGTPLSGQRRRPGPTGEAGGAEHPTCKNLQCICRSCAADASTTVGGPGRMLKGARKTCKNFQGGGGGTVEA